MTEDVKRKNGNISKGKKLFYGKSIVKYREDMRDITTLNLLKKGLPHAIKLENNQKKL